MPIRVPSPVLSENEIDIASSLFRDDLGGPAEVRGNLKYVHDGDNKAKENEGNSDADDAFIAETLVAANRKTSNFGGKVKKGGFQAMGLNLNLLKALKL